MKKCLAGLPSVRGDPMAKLFGLFARIRGVD